jgi:hypothetical protein
MWPRTSELEKIAKDNGRTWTGPNSQNLMKHEIIPFISRLPDRYRPFLEKYPSLALIGGRRSCASVCLNFLKMAPRSSPRRSGQTPVAPLRTALF